jgi:hypothetical protein
MSLGASKADHKDDGGRLDDHTKGVVDIWAFLQILNVTTQK